MSNTNPFSNSLDILDAATIQAAEVLSAAAYDTLSGASSESLAEDAGVNQLLKDGWTQVSTLAQQTNSADAYQGIAFYKTINGVTQVIIANRGTGARVGDLEMDWDIARGDPVPSDTDAQNYYNAVVTWVQSQVQTSLNVIETGHSLGGQDADYVMSQPDLTLASARPPTEAVTFDGTIYDNLLLANPQATFEDIVHAARMAEIHETIERLPKGYQSEIGERGAGLSGGQKQRLPIARALLKRPKILLFDEATSSLDSETAEHFAQTVNQLRGQATMLFIAHGLPKNLKVDEIVHLGAPSQRPVRHVPDEPAGRTAQAAG